MSADGVVERFLAAMVAHDWEAMGRCLTDDVVRVGPYLDTYRGRDEYVAFLALLLPSLPGYSMAVDRIVAAGSVVTAQLAETVDDPDGKPLRTPEALVFDLADDGRIARIEVFIQTAPGSR
jgi:ketosteroid isomerase-like protein